MKRIFVLLCLISAVFSLQLRGDNDVIEVENEGNDTFAGIVINLPEYREIFSGSKILVEYKGEWPLAMKGAFEYAVKLWEENLPLTLPIRITANVGTIKGGATKLSSVSLHTGEFAGSNGEEDFNFPFSAVKGTLLRDYSHNGYHTYFTEASHSELLVQEDIAITYNKAMIDQFSFNLDEAAEDKYDFVTLALRDIALGLGIGHSIKANVNAKEIRFPSSKPTPFEKCIIDAIGTDPVEAYKIATSGEVLALYAPDPFINGVSLQYYVPSDKYPLRRLLTYDFSKGYVMRDLTYADDEKTNYWYWNSVVEEDLQWKRPALWTGSGNSFDDSVVSSVDDEIPYKGEFSFSFDDVKSAAMTYPDGSAQIDTVSSGQDVILQSIKPVECGGCEPYSIRAFGNLPMGVAAYALSVQLKDGTWEVLDAFYLTNNAVTLDIERFPLSQSEDMYARTSSGGLKYRLVKRSSSGANGEASYQAKFFTRSYTPQSAEIQYSGIAEEPAVQMYASDDYYIDVTIDIADIEGAERVVVTQYEGDDAYPFYYEVEDFRKGSFIANLDRELETRLFVTSYNKNGTTRSNTITIPPLGYPDRVVKLEAKPDYVVVEGVSTSQIENNEVSYIITTPMNSSRPVESGLLGTDRHISTVGLERGIYVATLIRNGEIVGTVKFTK